MTLIKQMEVTELKIPNAFRLTPDPIPDRRGRFHESLRAGALSEIIGYPFRVAQVNYSVSRRGGPCGASTRPPCRRGRPSW
ncbi:hypothetical protein GCM10020000_11950 [Streptomyces olivoverticillatus]